MMPGWTRELRLALAAVLILALCLTGIGQGLAASVGMPDAAYEIPGVHVPICHAGQDTGSPVGGSDNPAQHDCCDACALLAPAILPAPPGLTSPAAVAYYASHGHAVAWVPTLSRMRSPRQAQGPPAA